MADERVIEQVAEGIEHVAEHVDEVAEVTRRLTSRDLSFYAGGFTFGVAVGVAIGYFTREKQLKEKYSKISEKEIEDVREYFHNRTMVVEEKPPLDEVVKNRGYDKIVREHEYVEPSQTTEEGTLVPATPEDIAEAIEETQAAYAAQDNSDEIDEWDYAVEIKRRNLNPGLPHIIHVAEFRQNEPEHDQTTFTLYEDDHVLCDLRDQVIDDVEMVVGVDNLNHFGHGSLDAKVLYVRNNRLGLDIEILLNPGNYVQDVHGLKHSDARRRHPNRRFDDE